MNPQNYLRTPNLWSFGNPLDSSEKSSFDSLHIENRALFFWSALYMLVSIGSNNGLLPDGAELYPEPVLTYHELLNPQEHISIK